MKVCGLWRLRQKAVRDRARGTSRITKQRMMVQVFFGGEWVFYVSKREKLPGHGFEPVVEGMLLTMASAGQGRFWDVNLGRRGPGAGASGFHEDSNNCYWRRGTTMLRLEVPRDVVMEWRRNPRGL